jgi:hypothetical protein
MRLDDNSATLGAVLASLAAVALAIAVLVVGAVLPGCASSACPRCSAGETCQLTTTETDSCHEDAKCVALAREGDQCGFSESDPNPGCVVGFSVDCAPGLQCAESADGTCPNGTASGDGHVSCCFAR